MRLAILPLPTAGATAGDLDQELRHACFFGHYDRLVAALRSGADPNAPSARGNRPLHLLVCARKPELMGPLLRAGADPFLPGASSLSAIDLARFTGQHLALRLMRQWVEATRTELFAAA